MYVGHFAAGLVIKARTPKAPTWALLLGVGWLDVLFGPFVLAGIERATVTPAMSPGFRLDYIDWSHSLLMSLVWAACFGLLFLRQGRRIAAAMVVAVFSHFVLDFLMHPADLALWPGSSTHLGLGLWQTLPRGWWWVELGFIAAAFGYYLAKSRPGQHYGGRPFGMGLALLALHVLNAPWLPR